MASRIVVVTGVSGVGKTSAVQRLATRGVSCAFFDSIDVPEVFPPDWQETTTLAWIRRLANDPAELVVLDGQTRPSFVMRACAEVGVTGSVVLFECARAVRDVRLAGRGQPELADMDTWAAYLRGQADALGLPVIDTSALDVDQAADALQALLYG